MAKRYVARAFLTQTDTAGNPVAFIERSFPFDRSTPEGEAQYQIDKAKADAEVRAAINFVDSINTYFDEKTLCTLHSNGVHFAFVDE